VANFTLQTAPAHWEHVPDLIIALSLILSGIAFWLTGLPRIRPEVRGDISSAVVLAA
jgi:hypothetical protein